MSSFRINLIIVFFILSIESFGQTATIKIDTSYCSSDFYRRFDSILFCFNGISFYGSEKKMIKIKLNKDFDQCYYINHHDTTRFYTKFLKNKKYVLTPGVSQLFKLKPKRNFRCGSMRFCNDKKTDLGFICDDGFIKDTVKTNTTYKSKRYGDYDDLWNKLRIYSVVKLEYFSIEDIYAIDPTQLDSIIIEKKKYRLTSIGYYFLHGEKLTLRLNDNNKLLFLSLDGYLTNKEIKNIRISKKNN